MNPNYQNGSKGANLSGGSSVNSIKPSSQVRRNTFDLGYNNQLTARFGDITPFFVLDSVSGDTIPFSSHHEIRSYTLSSPQLFNLRMHKTHIQVPMPAIMPRTWDYIFTNPTQGSDVPDDAMCNMDFSALLVSLLQIFQGSASDSLKFSTFLVLESICSNGSISHLLGLSASKFLKVSGYTSLENWFSAVHSAVTSLTVSLPGGSITYNSTRDDLSKYHYLCDKIRENPLANAVNSITISNATTIFNGVDIRYTTTPKNISRILSYQLACAEYFTNEFVDSIYSSQLFIDNVQSLMEIFFQGDSGFSTNDWYFIYNGVRIRYDVFSQHMTSKIFERMSFDNTDAKTNRIPTFLAIISLIFSFRHSLKYSDYFTSLKTRPLAVGDVKAPVVSNGVSAVEMTHRIQMQRFLNAVNRSGRKLGNYLKSIFGSELPPDMHVPHYVASNSYIVSGFEVNQTSGSTSPSLDDQLGKQVTVLRSQGNDFEFTVDTDVPCILIGLLHFDVVRSYADTIDRAFMHTDRFEMFNPFLQFIGDQSAKREELLVSAADSDNSVGYQQRYCEYKQRYSQAHGGFISSLPSWAFVDGEEVPGSLSSTREINSDFIRNDNYEFDRFYSILTGRTLSDYFHFIISLNIGCNAKRPLEINPNIL